MMSAESNLEQNEHAYVQSFLDKHGLTLEALNTDDGKNKLFSIIMQMRQYEVLLGLKDKQVNIELKDGSNIHGRLIAVEKGQVIVSTEKGNFSYDFAVIKEAYAV